MILAAVDWTSVIVAALGAVSSTIAATIALLVHRQVRTPSGKTLGEVAEYTHDTGIANNMLLSRANGPTKPADPADLRKASATAPEIPEPPPTP